MFPGDASACSVGERLGGSEKAAAEAPLGVPKIAIVMVSSRAGC
jgi:hypothetical protein